MNFKSPIRGLYAILETSAHPDINPVELVSSWLSGGIRLIQLRQKTLPPEEKLKQARALVRLKKERPFTFIINDDPDLCLQVNADGLHIGQEDITPTEARQIIGTRKILGLSTHSLKEAQRAQDEPVDYIGFGGIFPTTTKPKGHPVLGLENLKTAVELSEKPVVAIGGIDRRNLIETVRTGVASVAIVSALRDVPNAQAQAQVLIQYLKSAFF